MGRFRMTTGAMLFAIAAGNLYGVDGVVLIDQARALAGNVTPGDVPGFPVRISLPGSYRLSGNLTVPDAFTHGFEVVVPDVTIDLNGFSIIGPVSCTGGSFNEPPLSCTTSGNGRGITSVGHLTVTNGTIRGMGNHGIVASENCRIEKVHAISNAANGFSTLNGCVITDSVAMRNGTNGFFGQSGTFVGNTAYANKEAGFTCTNTCQISKAIASFNGTSGIAAGGGSVISGNSLFRNGNGISVISSSAIGNTVQASTGIGIFSQSSLVKDNVVRSSTSYGLQISIESGYSGNILQDNNGGNASPQIFPGVGSRNLGQNMCGTALCP